MVKLGMCIVKQICFDEIYVTTVPNHSSDQRLRKSNFGQLSNLSRLEIKNYLNNWAITFSPRPSTEFALKFFMDDV